MLLLHEVHEVVGRHEAEFEAAFRDGWLPALGATDDARLLHYLHHAHGTGASYNVVTLTLLRDAAAWTRLVARVHTGDLAGWARDVDRLRHDTSAKLLVPLPWSPVREIPIGDVPAKPGDHPPAVFMEDTVWPYPGGIDAYVERAGAHYAHEMARRAEEGAAILRIEASYRTAFGAGKHREVVLWQRVVRPEALAPLVSREVPERYTRPGMWMHDALEVRDRWESRLLRSATWSPSVQPGAG